MNPRLLILAVSFLLLAACGGSSGSRASHGGAYPFESSLSPLTGAVGADGGTVSRLYFAVVGDTRPDYPDDTANYPYAVIEKIFQDMQAMKPRPQFVVATGDYMSADAFGDQGYLQMDLYAQAARQFQGLTFAAMGNHECNTLTEGNCAGNPTNNMLAFEQDMVTPLGKQQPYYAVPLSAPDGSWTAKLLILACNAWDTGQHDWLAHELTLPTTYTFVVRHEPSDSTSAPCVTDSDALMQLARVDLVLVGHVHTFSSVGNELIVGIGGAPLTGPGPFGYATVEQIPGKGFWVTQYEGATALPISGFLMP